MNEKRRISITIICVLVIVIVLFLLLRSNKTEKMNDLKVTYSDKEISFNNFSKPFKAEQTITIENTSKENKTYSLEWSDVSNTLKKQNVFLYEIKCEGERCATLGKSQVPVASSVVYTQALIEGHKKQTYTIIFNYNGSEKNAKFKGNLKVYSKEIDKKKIEEQEKKEQERMEKELEKERKAETKKNA